MTTNEIPDILIVPDQRGWSRPDSRTTRVRHYFINGRSLCRIWGQFPGQKFDLKQKPGSDCQHCLNTLRKIDDDA